LPRLGRRTIYVGGLGVLTIAQYVIGILDCIPGHPSGAIWALSAIMLLWNFLYDLTIGPVCFVILGECSATRVRAKTIAIAIAAQGTAGIVMGVVVPYLINPGEANLQGKLGFVSGSLALICFVWAYFRVPETKNRTYEELDLLFDQKVTARKFKGHVLNVELSEEMKQESL
jgi:MFS transporter, SP family, general alpha glucoside:H+ symporter